jgi:heme exporter protein B
VQSDWQCLCLIVRQRFLMALRASSGFWQPLVFFILVMLLFPMAVGGDFTLLTQIAPGVLWVAVLLSLLLSLNNSFSEDQRDGTLESWMLAPYPLAWIMLAKMIADWLLTVVPLLLCLPIAILFFHLSVVVLEILAITLLLGTWALYSIGSIFSVLLVGFRQSSWLLALLLLPMTIPVLIFACSAAAAASEGISCVMQLAVLGIFALLCLLVCPFAIAAALRVGVQQG